MATSAKGYQTQLPTCATAPIGPSSDDRRLAPSPPVNDTHASASVNGVNALPRIVRFTTTAGTWMSLDISPDGQTIVFDLLGDLYTLPISGGRARPLTSGPAWDGQPRYSPDGLTIAFISDRSGVANAWLVDHDGRNARQLSDVGNNVNDSPISSPAWSPDGCAVLVSQRWGTDKHVRFHWDSAGGQSLSIRPSLKATQPSTWVLAVYDVATRRARWIVDTTESTIRPTLGAVFSPDGTSLYAATQLYPMDYAGAINYWRIDRVDISTGVRRPEMGQALARSGIRPSLSRDGQLLVYVSPSGTRYGVRLRNLRTHQERWLVAEQIDHPPLSGDVAAGISQLDLAPGYAFTPDSKALIIAFGGRIHRVDISTGRARVIPFVVDVKRELAPMKVHQFTMADTGVRVRSVMQPALSPDGRRVAFSSLGHLWVMTLPFDGRKRGQPWRLTADSLFEGYPSWSPDGRWIAYSAWQEGAGGMVRRAWVPTTATAGPLSTESVSRDTAAYSAIAVAHNGAHVFAVRTKLPPGRRASPFTIQDATSKRRELDSTNLVMLPVTGGPVKVIMPLPFRLVGPEGTSRVPTEQLYFAGDSGRIHLGLASLSLGGSDRDPDVTVRDSLSSIRLENGITGVLAPDGKRALLTHYETLWEATLPTKSDRVHDTLDVEEAERRAFGAANGAARRWGRAFAPWVSWSRDGMRVLFVQGATLFLGEVSHTGWTAFTEVDVDLPVPVDKPRGVVALRGARLLTMRGDPGERPVIIANGDLVVRDNRIVALGPAGTIPIPEDATVIELRGKTVLPGYVDIHDHFLPPFGVHSGQWWGALVRLAHGVTALREPGEVHMQHGEIHRLRDLERGGELIAPRLFTSGVPHVRSIPPVKTLDDAKALVHPNAEYFGTETFKEYSSDPWTSRRLIAAAAGMAGVNPTIHGDQLRAITDGFTGVEHNFGVPVYDDVHTFVAKSGTTLTNTFGVTAAAFGTVLSTGDEPWACGSMRRFVPPLTRDFLTKRWMAGVAALGRPEADHLKALFASAAGIASRGGRIGMGMHGNIPGMGIHYEMWFHAAGGMPAYEVLRSATSVSAAAIGHARDFGSLESGMLADLQILDANPLDDIHNTLTIRYVMKNGRLYDASDLTEIWPRRRPLPEIYLYKDNAVTATGNADSAGRH